MTELESALSFAKELFAAPYETYSRFTLEKPRVLAPEEAIAHVERGGGLSCIEKAMALSHRLDGLGIRNEIVAGAFELWCDGMNLMAYRGAGSEPPDEKRIAPFFAPSWETSPYEAPVHLAHWANLFEIGGKRHLVDVTGAFVPFRHYENSDVANLLDAKPKSYVQHFVPGAQRLYFHRLSPDLLASIRAKESTQPSYILGRFLATALFAAPHSLVNLKWWWRDEAYERDRTQLSEMLTRVSGGALELVTCESPSELEAELRGSVPAGLLKRFTDAWPAIQEWTAKLFDSPKYVRLMVTRSERPLVEHSPTRVELP